MFTRTTFVALAAAALFGVTAAIPSAASAFNGRGVSHGGSPVSVVRSSHSFARVNHFARSNVRRLGLGHGVHVANLGGHTHPGFKWIKHNKWTKNHWCKWGKCGKFKWTWWYRRHHRFYFARWHHFRYVTPLYATYAAPRSVVSYSAPAAPCNCLTKRYEDGAVIFEDVCTKESAISPPQDQAQAEPPSH